jgi:hypothetical protein
MPPPSIRRPELEPHQRELASLIDREIRRGQRGDGTPEHLFREWPVAKLAEACGLSENVIALWRKPDALSPPSGQSIGKLLNAFYGKGTTFAAKRFQMDRLWHLARGFIPPEPLRPDPWSLENPDLFQHAVNLVALELRQPEIDNNGNVRVPGTLDFVPDDNASHDGQPVSVGLTDALLIVQSRAWQPKDGSSFQQAPAPSLKPNRFPGSVVVIGPKNEHGMLDGAPFGDGPVLELAPIQRGGGPFDLVVCAPPRSIRVRPRPAGANAPQETSVNQDIIIDTIFGKAFDRLPTGQIVLAKAKGDSGKIL